ncbi:MAG: hypothetical protein ACE5OZ_23190 [Candidatus Heimdallarchaeota archaeon]
MHEKLKELREEGATLFPLRGRFTLVVNKGEYKENPYIGVRKFVEGEKYIGFTRQGINIPREIAKDVAEAILNYLEE